MNKISVPISVAELIDKYTILLIKKEEIKSCDKQQLILTEINELEPFLINLNVDNFIVETLKQCNKKIWDMEDLIRKKENLKMFDSDFIFYARTIYVENDKRSRIKNDINIKYKSFITEVKSYEEYITMI